MNHYDFQSTDFALSNEGVHLFRTRFNYKTISFQDLDKATIKRDVVTNRLGLTLAVGLILILFAFYQSINIYDSFIDPLVRTIYIESIVLPVLPLLIGVYCFYISVKKVPTLLVEKGGEKYKLRLNEIIENQQLADLQAYLRAKLTTKLIILEL